MLHEKAVHGQIIFYYNELLLDIYYSPKGKLSAVATLSHLIYTSNLLYLQNKPVKKNH